MDKKHSILVVDSDESSRKYLLKLLQNEGYSVIPAADGLSALDALKKHSYDLLILELDIPPFGGMEFVRRAGQADPEMRVIIYTGSGSLETAIQAIRYYVEDYILKPATPEELLDSVRKALSSSGRHKHVSVYEGVGVYSTEPVSRQVMFGREVQIDFARRRITCRDKEIHLTPTEARLLEVMLRYRNQVVAHADLVYRVQGYRVGTEEAARILRPLMSRLRKKLECIPGGDRWIQNVRGSGYLLNFEE